MRFSSYVMNQKIIENKSKIKTKKTKDNQI